MGIQIKSIEQDISQEDYILYNTFIGKVKDMRDFTETQIAHWVTTNWISYDDIQVRKVGKVFFFLCSDARDRASLLDLGSANFQGALIIFSKCIPHTSFRSHTFQRIPMWIKVEGLPLLYNKISIARRALDRIRHVLYFDNDSIAEGFKDYLSAKVIIPFNNPLVPGFFFNRQEGPREWINFRYEGVFTFCTKCGRIGHKRMRCRLPIAIAQRHFEMVLADIGQGVDLPIIEYNAIPLYSNKIIGLKRVERNRTSHVNLVGYSWERDKEWDSLSEHTIPDDENDSQDHSSSDSSGPDDQPDQNNQSPNQDQQRKDPDHSRNESRTNTSFKGASTSKRVRGEDHNQSDQRKKRKLSSNVNMLQDHHNRGMKRRMINNGETPVKGNSK